MPKIKFYTLGCKVNQYDTQSIREKFVRNGFTEAAVDNIADIFLINSCTVTQTADHKTKEIIKRCKKINPKAKIILTGCLVKNNNQQLLKIPGLSYIIPKRFFTDGVTDFAQRTRAFLKIQDGCNNFCTYCRVPLVRGASRSRQLPTVAEEAIKLAEKGFKEIVLTGICLGAYGKDLTPKKNLVNLINKLEKIDGLLRIRLSSIEATDITDALIKRLSVSKKLCKHLHIPIQSGDDQILRRMNRKISHNGYVKLITRIKNANPNIAITTDVMVGFPGETKENFANTIKLIQKIQPLKVHIFPYSPRPETAASLFNDAPNARIVQERIRQLRQVCFVAALKYLNKSLNQYTRGLIENKSKDHPGYWEGYSDNYVKLLVKSKLNLCNKTVDLKIKRIFNTNPNEQTIGYICSLPKRNRA